MAAPAIQTIANTDSGTNSVNTLTVDKPTGTVEGDLMLCICAHDETGAERAFLTLENGGSTFALHLSEGDGTSDSELGFFTREAGASEVTTYTLTKDGGGDQIWASNIRITGHNATPVDIVGTSQIEETSSPDAPSITTTVDDCLIFAAFGFDGADLTINTHPYNGTNATVRKSGTLSNECGGGWDHKNLATKGATGVATWAIDITDGNVAAQIAIAPVAAGALINLVMAPYTPA